MMGGNCITTYTGINFNPLDPKVNSKFGIWLTEDLLLFLAMYLS
ncbi:MULTISPECIES: hypothetical protein [Lysinibacillus]|nr:MULTISPECIES: hypothetical protein [Lysinibacillus]